MNGGLAAVDGALLLNGVLLERDVSEPVRADRVRIEESRLRGLVLEPGKAPGLRLSDVALADCDLSNVDGREGSLRRVHVVNSRLVGFGLAGGTVQDLRVTDSALLLASFAFAKLRHVVFERVNLAEVSFMEARLDGVEFIDCKLTGADFRGAKLQSCTIRGTPLDGIVGVDCLKGIAMPWPDILASAATLAAALGIVVEAD